MWGSWKHSNLCQVGITKKTIKVLERSVMVIKSLQLCWHSMYSGTNLILFRLLIFSSVLSRFLGYFQFERRWIFVRVLPNPIVSKENKSRKVTEGIFDFFCRGFSRQPPGVRLTTLAWLVVQFNEDTAFCEIVQLSYGLTNHFESFSKLVTRNQHPFKVFILVRFKF